MGSAGDPVALSPGRLALADSEQAGNPASNANDNSYSTRWSAADGQIGHWWSVDLGNVYDLSRVDITWEFANRLYGYVLEVSPDASSWTTALNNTENPLRDQTQSVMISAEGRYVRIRFTALDQSDITFSSITEATIFGH
jgi:hypothetical protein